MHNSFRGIFIFLFYSWKYCTPAITENSPFAWDADNTHIYACTYCCIGTYADKFHRRHPRFYRCVDFRCLFVPPAKSLTSALYCRIMYRSLAWADIFSSVKATILEWSKIFKRRSGRCNKFCFQTNIPEWGLPTRRR